MDGVTVHLRPTYNQMKAINKIVMTRNLRPKIRVTESLLTGKLLEGMCQYRSSQPANQNYPALSQTTPVDKPPAVDHYPTTDPNPSCRNDEWEVYFYLVRLN